MQISKEQERILELIDLAVDEHYDIWKEDEIPTGDVEEMFLTRITEYPPEGLFDAFVDRYRELVTEKT